jgi:hypothetical protein
MQTVKVVGVIVVMRYGENLRQSYCCGQRKEKMKGSSKACLMGDFTQKLMIVRINCQNCRIKGLLSKK